MPAAGGSDAAKKRKPRIIVCKDLGGPDAVFAGPLVLVADTGNASMNEAMAKLAAARGAQSTIV